MLQLSAHRKGVVLVLISAILWSTAGLLVRIANVDLWTMVAWRSAFAALVLGAISAYKYRNDFQGTLTRIGWPAIINIALSAFSGIAYVLALRLTTVANVMMAYATLPFIATGIAYFWLHERVTIRFLIASSASVAAILAVAGAVTCPQDLEGLLVALMMTAGFATQLVHTKVHPSMDATFLIALSSIVCVIVAIPLAHPGLPSAVSLLACALYGVLTTGLGYILSLEGGRLIPSAEAALISMLDTVLGPLWVWSLLAEQPSRLVLVSGSIVLGAVFWYLAGDRGFKSSATSASGG